MKLKIVLCFLATLSIWGYGSAVRADFRTGNELYADCTVSSSATDHWQRTAYCMGYITGAVDGMRTGNVIGQYILQEDANLIEAVCVPDRVTTGQLVDIVVNYIKNNPTKRHLNASVIVMNAVMEAWPCEY